MTKELAIKILSGETLGTNEQTEEAVKMAVEALKRTEKRTETHGVCLDVISRQAAIDAIEEYSDRLQMVNWKENPGVPYKVYTLNWCVNTIRELPSAQPRKKGKWIATQEWGGRNYSCSCCKFSFMVDTCMLEPMWNFCPYCGAEMKGEEDERIKNS